MTAARAQPPERRLLYVDRRTHYLLKLLASYRGAKMMDLLAELVRQEARRLEFDLGEGEEQ